ncbi:MAG TPA: MFS transporter [Candidatus Bathyarchaeia archaeon]|nr:MFS transporter [Candidatus Bathyarchaeia archaeon]
MNHYPEENGGISKRLPRGFQPLPGYSGLYLSTAFRSLGMDLISLFIPLYILNLTGNVFSIFLFYSLYHFICVVTNYPTAVLTKRFGIDLVGFLGAMTRAVFIFFLIKAESQISFLWLAAIFWGTSVSLIWLPFHYSFTIAEQEDKKYGKEVSQYQIVSRITGLIGPVTGGLVISSLGFGPLFLFAIILTISSGIPLFFDTIKRKGMRLSLAKITQHMTRRGKTKFWLSFVGGQLEGAVLGLVWPLFIYLVVKNYGTVGLIKSGASIVSVILVWFLGRWIDKKGKAILRLGTMFNSFNVLLRPFLFSPFALFLVDSAYGITSDLVITPFDSAFYEAAVKMRKLEFIVEREFVIHSSATLICLFLGFLFTLKVDWFWIFALAVVGILMQNLILNAEEPGYLNLLKRLLRR